MPENIIQPGQIWKNKLTDKLAYIVNKSDLSISFRRAEQKFGSDYNKSFFIDDNIITITLENLLSNYGLIKPKSIAVGQMWELFNYGTIPYTGKESIIIRITSIHMYDVFGAVYFDGFFRRSYQYGDKYQCGLSLFQSCSTRILSEIPKCFYCLCYWSDEFLPLKYDTYICRACRAEYTYI